MEGVQVRADKNGDEHMRVEFDRKWEKGLFQHNKERSGDYFRRLEETSFTIFVDNLPSSLTKAWSYQLFKFEGKVVDIYI